MFLSLLYCLRENKGSERSSHLLIGALTLMNTDRNPGDHTALDEFPPDYMYFNPENANTMTCIIQGAVVICTGTTTANGTSSRLPWFRISSERKGTTTRAR
mmetsp:Transcript_3182/g.4382  ORF Transcript_3182/g.4382 Transcript_3182/m.4382 type:complete len:101 (-) Transcript_3182:104-406(-)